MNIIDHMSVGVSSIAAGTRFYNGLMAVLECELIHETESFAVYGKDKPQFLLMTPYDKETCTPGNGAHLAFIAPSQQAVEAFYQHACSHGALSESGPAPRPKFPGEGTYSAYVRDPFGNRLEIIFNGYAV